MSSLSSNLLPFRGATSALYVMFAVLLVASITDLSRRRIPNWLTFPTALVAIALHFGLDGFYGGVSSALSYVVFFAGGFAFYRFIGGIGAGDVKLLMACAALCGAYPALYIALFSFLLQSLYLFVRWIVQGTAVANFRRFFYWIYGWFAPGARQKYFVAEGAADRSPHGPFICAGAALALYLWRGGHVHF